MPKLYSTNREKTAHLKLFTIGKIFIIFSIFSAIFYKYMKNKIGILENDIYTYDTVLACFREVLWYCGTNHPTKRKVGCVLRYSTSRLRRTARCVQHCATNVQYTICGVINVANVQTILLTKNLHIIYIYKNLTHVHITLGLVGTHKHIIIDLLCT